mmetsp:Transcript_27644/g.77283  ORF Transcript_27644/g.77283 Transcript_27644/m.77283 type:complete len:403 (-) Transcript_27644:330-1538(-)
MPRVGVGIACHERKKEAQRRALAPSPPPRSAWDGEHLPEALSEGPGGCTEVLRIVPSARENADGGGDGLPLEGRISGDVDEDPFPRCPLRHLAVQGLQLMAAPWDPRAGPHEQMHQRRFGGTDNVHAVDAAQFLAQGCDVRRKSCRQAGLQPQGPERLVRGRGEERRQRGAEDVGRSVEPLVVADDFAPETYPPHGSEGVPQGRQDDVHAAGLHPEVLAHPSARGAEHPQRVALLHNEAILELAREGVHPREGRDVPAVAVEPFHHDELAPGGGLPPGDAAPRVLLLTLQFQQHPLQGFTVVVREIPGLGPREGDAALDAEADGAVRHDRVPGLAEGRDDGGGQRHVVRVQDGLLRAEEGRRLLLEVQVDVDRPVEAPGAARPAPVLVHRLPARCEDAGVPL